MIHVPDELEPDMPVWALVTAGILPMADMDSVSLDDVCDAHAVLRARREAAK